MTPKERDELVGQVTAAAINLRDVERALVGLAQAGPEGLHNAAVKACIATRALMRALGYAEEGTVPIATILHCPWCQAQHIDEGEWATRPHHTHLCAKCGRTWRVEPYCAIDDTLLVV